MTNYWLSKGIAPAPVSAPRVPYDHILEAIIFAHIGPPRQKNPSQGSAAKRYHHVSSKICSRPSEGLLLMSSGILRVCGVHFFRLHVTKRLPPTSKLAGRVIKTYLGYVKNVICMEGLSI